jgi:3-oxoacyl-[acyl-carrier-protein] synthase-1
MSGSVRVIEVDRDNPIVVTAHGMVSSLGLDVATSCAAARAGLRRAKKLDNLKFASLDGRTVECAVGHQAPIITHGFEGAPRLAQLVAGALRDISSRTSVSSGRKGLYLSMPSCRRHLTGAELIPDTEVKQSFLQTIEAEFPALDDRISTDKVLSLALQQTVPLRDITLRFVTYAGHTGFAEALAVAVEELRRCEVDLALVGGVDSLADERSLRWLRLTGRLKGEANPAGLEPGEGAVFLTVERIRDVDRRQSPVLSRIDNIALAEEDRPRLQGQQPTGRALSGCIRSVAGGTAELWLLSDHNGETSRAMEFGNVLARLANPKTEFLPALFPSAAFGDTCSASAGLAACMAQSTFYRDCAPSGMAIIVSIGDGPQRSAFSLASLQEN